MRNLLFAVAALLLCAPCFAQEKAPAPVAVVETASLEPLFARASALLESGVKPLVVFDIDNTLLVSDLYLGSEAWYSSAYGRIAPLREADPAAFAPKNECLVRLLSRVQAAAPWRLTEPDLPRRLAALQAAGAQVLALTSRNHLAVELTLASLKKQGLDFARSAPWRELEGFSPWPGARALIYKKGVCFGRGEDKGRILLALFEKFSYTPQAVLFADDSAKNAASVSSALRGAGITVTAYRYSAFDALMAEQAGGADASRAQLKYFVEKGELISNARARALPPGARLSEKEERAVLFCD